MQKRGNTHIIRVVEEIGLDDEESFGTRNEYIVKDGKTGKILYHDLNLTVLGGRLALIEDSFNVASNLEQHLLLNDTMGIAHSATQSVFTSNMRRGIDYFMVGDGAKSPTVPNQVAKARNYETRLYNAIPFRFRKVTEDLSAEEQKKYRLKKQITIQGVDYYGYFAKKITFTGSSGSNAKLVITDYNGVKFLPEDKYTVPVAKDDTQHPLSGGSVKVYLAFSLEVDQDECKEYFKVVNGNLDGACINETALIKAIDLPNANNGDQLELAAAEVFAKLTEKSQDLDETTSRVVKYKVYAR